ncbi:MAG: 5-(carboxyamino)imidazole ribonucleotide mutase [Thermotogae bacterium]|nr:5-(carboxyamino)imidazole ribonucleotide mutase [Thermotogota bacterium]
MPLDVCSCSLILTPSFSQSLFRLFFGCIIISVKVSVIAGSSSDAPFVKEVVSILKEFGVKTEVKVLSAHRTPYELQRYVEEAPGRGVELFIAVAGKSAHLPGVIAALSILPVIGLPVPVKHLYGVDALLSMVQMPPGVPVATVGIGETKNAALLSISILSLKYENLRSALKDYREKMRRKVLSSQIDVE